MVRFTTKKIDSLTLGERMKKMRDDRRLTIAEVAKSTKIQAKYLQYFEDNDCAKLPADVYAKGFLRSYAAFMGVSEKILIKQYEREKGIQKNLSKADTKSSVKEKISFSNFVITPGVIAIGTIVVIAALSIVFIYKEVDSFVSAPRLLILTPQDDSTADSNTTHVSGVAEKDALVFINDQPVLVDEKGDFSEDVGLKDGVNTITVKAQSKFQKQATQSVTVNVPVKNDQPSTDQNADQSVSDQQALGQTAPQAAPDAPATPLAVVVSVGQDSTWISVEADGNTVYSGTVLANSKQVFNADDNVKITSGKGSETFVNINGKDTGALSSDSGTVRDVEYNLQGKVATATK